MSNARRAPGTTRVLGPRTRDWAAHLRSYVTENRERIVRYLSDGIKQPGGPTLLGVEVEHFVVFDDGRPVSYERHDSALGIREVLEYLSAFYPERAYGTRGDLIGLSGSDGAVSLEPAAQLEFSCAPCTTALEVQAAYRRFRDAVDPFLQTHGAHIVSRGYHPTRKALDLELIPKQRYRFMDEYFARIGTHGERMMRSSCATQVSVDYYSEQDAVRKIRVASAIAPVLAAIADNSPVFEGAENHTPLRRMQLWREVDNLRCGAIPGVFDAGFGFERYADWIMRTPPIFVTRPAAATPAGPALRAVFEQAADKAYQDAPLEDADIEHVISMFWPDVRLKHFVEVRPADCLPADCAIGYTALVKGIFYSEESLAAIERELGVKGGVWPIRVADLNNAIVSVQVFGMRGKVYGKTLESWEKLLFELAEGALEADEAACLGPLRAFAHDKNWWAVETAREV